MKKIISVVGLIISMNTYAGLDEGIELYHAGKYKEAFVMFNAESEKGDPAGQHLTASLYYQGLGVEKDLEIAVKLFKQAAEGGYLPSIANLGLMYMQGDGVEQDPNSSFRYTEKAAELGDLQSIFNLGQFYRKGFGVEPNQEKAAQWYGSAAESGVIQAQNEYGLMFAQGHGVELDYVKAYAWIKMPAEAGDGQALKNLAQLKEILGSDISKAEKLAEEYKLKYAANK
ncbi:tetratricopeptide repeat protein [Microbulbifer sp. EKSA008]|uniref:tetratricopeptide repeat protein n=1 Tax=Microbulbifer sp. EKSA008 TaxID=3243367 RepID=UPI004043031F